MTDIKPLEKLLDWKLLKGSHDWPGPHGGTCINEAAIVAAGFEYQSVSHAEDCPPCFSPVISAYLIALNDRMGDKQRQQLKRFVTRLSGSRDTPEVEHQRLEFIVIETVRRVVAMAMDAAGLKNNAAKCRAAATFVEATNAATAAAAAAANAAKAATYATYATKAADAAKAATYATYATKAADAAGVANAAAKAAGVANAADYAAYAAYFTYATKAADAAGVANAANAAKAADYAAYAAYAADAAVCNHCIEIVEGALAIGNQATDIDTALVIERMDKIRQRVTA